MACSLLVFFFQAEDGIRDYKVTGVQTCALPIYHGCSVFRPSSSPFPPPWPERMVQHPDQVLAVQVGPLLCFIEQTATARFVGSAILLADLFQILLARVHVHLSWVSCFAPSWVTFSFDPTRSLLVTFYVTQFGAKTRLLFRCIIGQIQAWNLLFWESEMHSTGLEETLRGVLGALAPNAAPAASSYEY